MTTKNHFAWNGEHTIALCKEENWHSLVTDIKDVTCKKCLKLIDSMRRSK